MDVLTCIAPAHNRSDWLSASNGTRVEVTLNGQTHGDELTTSEVSFAYYDDAGFAVSRVHPWGGPAAGGTTLAIHLAAASLHVFVSLYNREAVFEVGGFFHSH